MQLVLPLIAMFIFVGLTQKGLSRRTYAVMILVIVVALGWFYVSE